ncbi:MAG: TVP38/TMEM64 family protein [Planctomycetia bacterium]
MGRRRRSLLLAALLALVAASLLLDLPLAAAARGLHAHLVGLGAWGPPLFALGFALLVACLVPGPPLAMVAGAAFGLPVAVPTLYVGATLGSVLAFLVARSRLRPRIERWLAGHPRLLALDELMATRGTWVACLLRLAPGVPFTLLNYALGLTRLPLKGYLLASLAMLPGILANASLGAAAGAALDGELAGSTYGLLLGVGALAAVVATVWLARVARNALPAAPGGSAGAQRAASQPRS